jgi:TolA-binding protein
VTDSDDPVRSGLFGRRGASRLREAEAALESRLRQLDETAAELAATAEDLDRREARSREVVDEIERRLDRDNAELDAREAALDAYATRLDARETDLGKREAAVEERRRELGAVELQRASVERREQALLAREGRLEEPGTAIADTSSHVLFVPGERYSLAERPGPAPPVDAAIELGGRHYLVIRLGASPLPGDARACAYLTA